MSRYFLPVIYLPFLLVSSALAGGNNYKNFDVASYARVIDVQEMKDPAWLERSWAAVTKYVKFDKIYLETHRDTVMPDQATLDQAKKFFASKGVKVAGGITWTIMERNGETYCYSNPEHLKLMKKVVEFTAKNFDEILLDDWFFTNCKSDIEIAAKGDRSWTQYRLDLMDRTGRELMVNAAKAVNPKVKVIIKYPQWYDHFQSCGFNLETQPKYFDGVYSGTETRDPVNNSMHIQQYHGYSIFRYLENLNHNNRGGWVDQGGSEMPNRYEEQLWITLFAKAPEITLWPIGRMLAPGFDFSQPLREVAGDSRLAAMAGPVFEKVDRFIGQMGNPIGVKSYKPFNSYGEDYLPSYLGMAGIPMDIVPQFPTEAQTVLLTEQAGFDPNIVTKIKKQLTDGKTVVITTGLLKALKGRLDDIVELQYTGRTVATREFMGGRGPGVNKSDTDILVPEITFFTNDSGPVISALTSASKTSGVPILHRAKYSKGLLYVLTVPQAPGDLYAYPQPVLNTIREVLGKEMYVRLDAPSRVSLFVYDNDKFIVESFQENPVPTARVITDQRVTKLRDMLTGQVLAGTPQGSTTVFNTPLVPGSYRVFSAE
jgi:hypothetical protein